MWLSPCCWINGSEMPNALIRLRNVPRFCLIALSDMSRNFSGLITTFSTKRSPVLGPLARLRSGYSLPMMVLALSRSSAERSSTEMPLPATGLRVTDS